MNKVIKSVILFAGLILITGCGATQYIKTSYTDNSCQVFVFRDTFALIYGFDIEVDNKAYAKLSDETYTRLFLPAGKRTISAKWFPGSGGVDLDVPKVCKPKETLYIAFSGGVQGSVGGYTRKIIAINLSKEKAKIRMKTYQKIGE